MKIIIFIAIVFIASYFLTRFLRYYALSRSLIDIPNNRSSHTIPTPRGGGVAIVLSFLLVLPFLRLMHWMPWNFIVTAMGAGVAVALLGFLDDHGHIAARWRLLGHFLSAGWALYWLGGIPAIPVFGVHVDLGMVGLIIAALYMVWMLNLYNFMDGIDGIASVEAICVCLGGALLYVVVGAATLAVVPLLLAAAVAGFLCWNFPPARIFMGDAGSGFLGMILAILSLQAAWVNGEFFWSWIILLGVFIVDATFTLLRRLSRGDKIYEAHRSHAYQYASRHFKSHKPVTVAVIIINSIWLLPIALLVGLDYIDGVLGVIVAYAPLLWLTVKFKAGQLEKINEV